MPQSRRARNGHARLSATACGHSDSPRATAHHTAPHGVPPSVTAMPIQANYPHADTKHTCAVCHGFVRSSAGRTRGTACLAASSGTLCRVPLLRQKQCRKDLAALLALRQAAAHCAVCHCFVRSSAGRIWRHCLPCGKPWHTTPWGAPGLAQSAGPGRHSAHPSRTAPQERHPNRKTSRRDV